MDFKEQVTTFINESVQEAFSTMLTMDVAPAEKVPDPTGPDGLICSIGFTGDLEGSISSDITNTGACLVASKMLCMEIEEVSVDVTDGVGEILNIAVSGFKTRMAGLGYDFKISVPIVIKGQDLKLAIPEDKEKVEVSFSADDFEFGVIVIYKSTKKEDDQKSSEVPAVEKSAEIAPAVAESSDAASASSSLAQEETSAEEVSPEEVSPEEVSPEEVKPAEEVPAQDADGNGLDDAASAASLMQAEDSSVLSQDSQQEEPAAPPAAEPPNQEEPPLQEEISKQEEVVPSSTGSLIPKDKVAELVEKVEAIPGDSMDASEAKNILQDVMDNMSSPESDQDYAEEIDRALQKLDDLLIKIKSN